MSNGHRSRRSLSATAVLTIGLMLILAACGDGNGSPVGPTTGTTEAAEDGPEEVDVVVIAPLTGAFAVSGEDILESAKMAADEINEGGGIESLGGAQINVVSGDAGEDAASVTAIARELLSDEPSAAMGSWFSSLSLAATQVAEQMQIPWVTGSYTDELVERDFSYVFQTTAGLSEDVKLLPTIVEILVPGDTSEATIVIGSDNNQPSEGFITRIKGVAEEAGATLATVQQWTPPISDTGPIASQLLAEEPDIIFINSTSITDQTRLMQELANRGNTAPLVGLAVSQLHPSFLENVGEEGMEGTTTPVCGFPGPGSEEVVERWTERSGHPHMSAEAFTGYTSMWTIGLALEDAASADPQDVRDALAGLEVSGHPAVDMLAGPGGTLSFGENGRRNDAECWITQWQSGTPVIVYPPEVAEAEPITAEG